MARMMILVIRYFAGNLCLISLARHLIHCSDVGFLQIRCPNFFGACSLFRTGQGLKYNSPFLRDCDTSGLRQFSQLRFDRDLNTSVKKSWLFLRLESSSMLLPTICIEN